MTRFRQELCSESHLRQDTRKEHPTFFSFIPMRITIYVFLRSLRRRSLIRIGKSNTNGILRGDTEPAKGTVIYIYIQSYSVWPLRFFRTGQSNPLLHSMWTIEKPWPQQEWFGSQRAAPQLSIHLPLARVCSFFAAVWYFQCELLCSIAGDSKSLRRQ